MTATNPRADYADYASALIADVPPPTPELAEKLRGLLAVQRRTRDTAPALAAAA